MNVIATAKIIAARIRFRDWPGWRRRSHSMRLARRLAARLLEQLRHLLEHRRMFGEIVGPTQTARVAVGEQRVSPFRQTRIRKGSSIPTLRSLCISGVPALGLPNSTTSSSSNSMPSS